MARKADKPRKDHGEDVHDVLAAEEFPPPAGADADTPAARAHRALPPDPAGTEDVHDVLAAEEFPPPAHADVTATAGAPGRSPLPRLAVALGAALAGYALARRRRR